MLADRRRIIPILAAVPLALGVCFGVTWGQASDRAADSAIFLLNQATLVSEDGKHNALLRALRQLRDPELKLLFKEMAQRDQPELKIHGILGLAELDPEAGLDLALLAQIERPEVQGELVTAALDDGLVSPQQAQQIVAWPGLDPGVKLLVLAGLFDEVEIDRDLLIEQSTSAEKLGRRGLASLLLLQLGDTRGAAGLEELNQSTDEQRDVIRAMLLNTATRHNFDRTTDWALGIANDPDASPILRMLALQTAMRFEDERAYARWETLYGLATDAAELNRLGLVALQLSPQLPPHLFDPMIASDDPMLRGFGQTGRAIAAGQADAPERALALLDLGHPLATHWLLGYAAEEADLTDAQVILLGIVYHVRDADRDRREAMLNQAVLAAEALHNLNPDAAIKLLQPVLLDPKTDPLVAQAILLGLLRSTADEAERIFADQPDFTNPSTQSLALLLKATSDQTLSQRQIADLGLVVGSTLLEDTLRMQAAWCYLKYTGRSGLAITSVIH